MRLNVMALAFGIVLSPTLARADQLIGTLPYTVGPPPLQVAGTFYSPTPQIRFWRSNPITPNVHGHDVAATTCAGHQFHVVGSCRVNGLSIPWSSHLYQVWDICQEIYSWHDVVVDLGHPGSFTVQVNVDNTLHLGAAGISQWQIWTVGEVPPPFAILSATFDHDFYQEGSTAQLTITTKSNWGTGTGMSLVPVMVPAVGDELQLVSQSFSLTAGEERINVFQWPVPDLPYCTYWDVRVDLWDDGQVVASDIFESEVASNEVDPAETEQVQAQMAACNAGAACFTQALSVIPYVGLLINQQASANLSCLADAYMAAGDERNARLFRHYEEAGDFLTVLELASVGYAIQTGGGSIVVLETGEVVGSVALAGAVCSSEWVYWQEYGGGRAPLGSYVAELGDSVLSSIDSAGVPCADLVLVEGRNVARVLVDSCHSTEDSVGLVGATVLSIGPNHEASWTHIWPNPRCFGTNDENPHAISRIEIRPDGADSLAPVLLHRTPDGYLRKMTYGVLGVDSTTVLSLNLADTLWAVSLEVDLDGDGTVDSLVLPGGVVTRVGDADRVPVPRFQLLANQPNPFNPVTEIRYAVPSEEHVELAIYDVAGSLVVTLVDGRVPVGEHVTVWNGHDATGAQVPSGTYFARLHAGEYVAVRKMVLLR